MKNMKKGFGALVAGAVVMSALVAVPAAEAASSNVVAKATRILIDNSNFGGCMVQLSVNPQGKLAACGGGWVSFDCVGAFNDPEISVRMLDQAQLALVTGANLRVAFTDEQMHNGYCVAKRVDVFK